MMSWSLRRAPIGGGLVVIVLLVFACFGAGCGQAGKLDPILVDCANTFVARDSSKVQLLEYFPQENSLAVKASAIPEQRVIMTAVFDCKSGQLLYGTWKRMTASSKAELHFKGADAEAVLQMDEGLNMLLPLPSGEVLAETGAVKRGAIDAAIGDLSTDEGARNLPSPDPSQHYRIGDLPVQGQIYLEDSILDVANRKEVRRIRGTLGRREQQDGKIISYAMDQTVYEFDPQTGRRTRLHDYRTKYTFGVPMLMLPLPAYYFNVGGTLYAAVGAKAERKPDIAYLAPSRIYSYDPATRSWLEVVALDFQPKWASLDGGRIILIGASRIGIYDIRSNRLTTQDLDLGAYDPTSLVRIGDNWALSVALHAHDPDKPAEDAQIWIVRGVFDVVLLKYPMKNFGTLQLSSQATPLPPAWH